MIIVTALPAVAVAAISISYSILFCLCNVLPVTSLYRCIPLEPPIHFGSSQTHHSTKVKPFFMCLYINTTTQCSFQYKASHWWNSAPPSLHNKMKRCHFNIQFLFVYALSYCSVCFLYACMYCYISSKEEQLQLIV